MGRSGKHLVPVWVDHNKFGMCLGWLFLHLVFVWAVYTGMSC